MGQTRRGVKSRVEEKKGVFPNEACAGACVFNMGIMWPMANKASVRTDDVTSRSRIRFLVKTAQMLQGHYLQDNNILLASFPTMQIIPSCSR